MESSLTAVSEHRQSVAVLLLMLRWSEVIGSDAFKMILGVRQRCGLGAQ